MKLTRKKRMLSVSTNAMSDVAFLLLIFIMLVALINYRREIDIDYAQAETALKVSEKENLEIWVNLDGAIFIDGTPASFDELEGTINKTCQLHPDTRIHILADRNTPYENVDAIISLLQSLQYRSVSLVVKDEK